MNAGTRCVYHAWDFRSEVVNGTKGQAGRQQEFLDSDEAMFLTTNEKRTVTYGGFINAPPPHCKQ